MLRHLIVVAALAGGAGLSACARNAPAPLPSDDASPLGPSPAPASNPDTPEKVALGAQLFYDPRLSATGTMSCEGCHYRALGWTDTLRLSTRATGVVNARHTPTLYNVGHQTAWYWDGRATSLEGQIAAAWKSQLGANTERVAAAVNAVPEYRTRFAAVFGDTASEPRIAQALASYVRTLNSGPSPWDRFQAGDRRALGAEAQAGWQLFIGKAGCAACHVPPRFADGLYHNVGLEAGKATPDRGRAAVTNAPADERAFKTPTLRSVALSRPYFHDGSAATLEAAVRYMASGGGPDSTKSPLLVNRSLGDVEVRQLVAFLQALTSDEPAPRPRVP
ncbi:MAG: cytochrome-c peroxidase [Gemmatimonadota bacterium]|jgi:cytochrome c peroxidase|nr:cytochrome-c peroxidase [Gemmatimonadota bacterium]